VSAQLLQMPTSFRKVAEGLPVCPVVQALDAHPELWGQHGMRKATYAHAGMTDIWVRYNAIENLGPQFNDKHVPVWYPAADYLPIAPIWRGLMSLVGGEMLGGILITKVPAGGQINPHTDAGWHAGYFLPVASKSASGVFNTLASARRVTKRGSVWPDSTREMYAPASDPENPIL